MGSSLALLLVCSQTRVEAEEKEEAKHEAIEEKSPFETMFQDLHGDADYFKSQLSGANVTRNKFVFLCDSSKPYFGYEPADLKKVLEQC